METIKPIETFYKGYRFRSRLEARWAVFFDALGIPYLYETEGYDIGNGDRYLPDFYLPTLKYYVEVKGYSDHIEDDLQRAAEFVKGKKTALVILSNIPYDPAAKGLFLFPILFYVGKSHGSIDSHYAFFVMNFDGNPYLNDYFYIAVNKHFSYWGFGMTEEDKNDSVYRNIQALPGSHDGVDEDSPDCPHSTVREVYENELVFIEKALIKARQARFEHGERP